jgi:hypothetical protein
MAKIHLRSEILFRAPTRIGLLADVTERLFAKDVNILGIRAYEEDDTGVFLIYASDSRAASEALELLGGTISTMQVVSAEVPNTPGQLAAIAGALANADINIVEVYATATDAPTVEIVLQTADNIRAIDLLQEL